MVTDLRLLSKSGLIIAVLLALLSGFTVSGLLTTSKTLTSSGSVKTINVEVYWDNLCTHVVNSVDWGTPEPGEVVDQTVYIKNSGSAPLNVSIKTSNWTPVEAANYITFTWDNEGVSIDSDQVLQASLTLTVSDAITGISDFLFNIVIEGTG
ncbi:hypothetical protein MCGE09_00094 [Thaumarchaeota archaeon SCGC AB-539-E09]|nr:hypothetical protein MCGE09_00094 [Thaumarchaeota archaeon SCGC AB-539-E09]